MRIDFKVFCIGLNKTGTSSLHIAFQSLGLKSVHYKEDDKDENIKDIISKNHQKEVKLLTGIDQYDAYSDWNHPSTNILFKELDMQYPNSKFILNTRNLNDWLTSREKHVKRIKNLKKLQKQNPKSPWYNIDKNIWKIEYINHHESINNYFKNRESHFLNFDITKGDGWIKLCNFLKLEIPESRFPKTNTSRQKLLNYKN